MASFLGNESGTIFSTGYSTNVATIGTLVGEGDTVITELTNHNSIQTGVAHSGAKILKFTVSNLATLKRALERATGTTLVVVDAVFSMDGTILPLPEVVELCNQYGATLMLDEAHSFGVLGETGRGIVEHFGMSPEDVDIRMGTLSKAIPSVGGFVVASETICRALSRGAHGYLFTGSHTAGATAAALAGLNILRQEPERVIELQEKSAYFRNRLRDALLPVWGEESIPIIPVVYESLDLVLEMTKALYEKDIFVVPAVHPAVSKKTPRIRFSITNDHSYGNLDRIADTFIAINDNLSARDYGVINL